MKKLLRELRELREIEGHFAPLYIVRYLRRHNYLNVSEILKHLENLEHYGYRYPFLLDAMYEFYDLFAVELFQLHRFTLRERSDHKSLILRKQNQLFKSSFSEELNNLISF